MGKVYLVGAGPGDPELLTVRATRVLERADVVLHDALVSQAVLDLINPKARVIDIGKRRGHKLLTQDEMNSLLVHFGKLHDTVVRLKGGDPSIFGRAGEEIESLLENGVIYEIVPGITAALSSAAAAGISLTDRRFASSVVFTTAHRGHEERGLEWDKLVTSGATLAIYMPGQDYATLRHQLGAAGVPADMPVLVVSKAFGADQRVMSCDVRTLGECNALPAPSLVIVGRCAGALSPKSAESLWNQKQKQDRQTEALI